MNKSVCQKCRETCLTRDELIREERLDYFDAMWEAGHIPCPEQTGGGLYAPWDVIVKKSLSLCVNPPSWCRYPVEHAIMEANPLQKGICKACFKEMGVSWKKKDDSCWKNGTFFCPGMGRLVEIVEGTPIDCLRLEEQAEQEKKPC